MTRATARWKEAVAKPLYAAYRRKAATVAVRRLLADDALLSELSRKERASLRRKWKR